MEQMGWATANETGYDFDKWFFQFDLDLPNPEFPSAELKHFPAHNWQGPGRPAYATFFATRSPSLQDPYFLATQQGVFRLLWDPASKSEKYPVVVFVAPFVTQDQRDMFAAAGAIVRELPLVPFHPKESPNGGGVAGRLMDMFSKLEMWRHTDFSQIAYMDSDAFALENIDHLFDIAKPQRCIPELMDPKYASQIDALCEYTFAGKPERPTMVNAGVMVIQPNQAMHDMLIAESHNTSNYEQGMMEQSFVNYIFRPDGPFPPHHLDSAWNGFPSVVAEGGELFVLHAKIWFKTGPSDAWSFESWQNKWREMVELYGSEEFLEMREQDRRDFEALGP